MRSKVSTREITAEPGPNLTLPRLAQRSGQYQRQEPPRSRLLEAPGRAGARRSQAARPTRLARLTNQRARSVPALTLAQYLMVFPVLRFSTFNANALPHASTAAPWPGNPLHHAARSFLRSFQAGELQSKGPHLAGESTKSKLETRLGSEPQAIAKLGRKRRRMRLAVSFARQKTVLALRLSRAAGSILRGLLGYPSPPRDRLKRMQRRSL